MIKGVTHDSHAHLGPIWYNSDPSDVPYSPKLVTGHELVFAISYSKPALAELAQPY